MGTPIPLNAASFALRELAQITAGTIVTTGAYGPDDVIVSISTDTRTLTPGSFFVALAGEHFDGHAYLEAAVQNGARAALVERDVAAPAGLALIRCASTLAALGDLAKAHVERWRSIDDKRLIVAITGSAGKTTTRIATTAMLEKLYPGKVHSTKGNLNNLVGVPMVAFGLDKQHQVAVSEMGMNQPGEMDRLAAMVRPDVAVVTLVSAAHVEGVGSVDAVAHEKGALYRALLADGIAIANGDDDRVVTVLKGSPAAQRISYGAHESVDMRIANRRPEGLFRSRVTFARRDGSALEFVTPLIGEAGAYACAAAISVAEAVSGKRVASEVAEEAFALAEVGGGAGRLVPRSLGRDVVVIDDSYNANPASSAASIRTAAELARASQRRLVLVLGAMYELGVESANGHDAVGCEAGSSGAAMVFAVGGDAVRIADRATEVGVPSKFFPTSADAAKAVVEAVRPGDLVLVKGSRGVGTERIVHDLSLVFGFGATDGSMLQTIEPRERVVTAEATV